MVPLLKSMDVQCLCFYSDVLLASHAYILVKFPIRHNEKEKSKRSGLKSIYNFKIHVAKPFLLK